MFRTLVLILFVAAFFALLVACGDNSQESISVTITESQLERDHWSVAAGNEVKVTLTNHGGQDQVCALLRQGTSITAALDANDEEQVFWKIEAEPGEVESEEFMAPGEAGVYGLVCGNSGQLEQGRQGTLTVE